MLKKQNKNVDISFLNTLATNQNAQHGAARHLKSCSQMKQMLEDVLFNEETRRSMREACLRIGCPKAGQISAEKMAALVEEVEE